MFEPLNRLIKNKKWQKSELLFCAQVCFVAEEAIKKTLPKLKGKFKVISFKNQRLKVAAGDPIAAFQIRMEEEKILALIYKKIKIRPLKITYSLLSD